jgi:hypothetical protein
MDIKIINFNITFVENYLIGSSVKYFHTYITYEWVRKWTGNYSSEAKEECQFSEYFNTCS